MPANSDQIYGELLNMREDIGKIKSRLDAAIVINLSPKSILASIGVLGLGSIYISVRIGVI